jgi:hypothetical protein
MQFKYLLFAFIAVVFVLVGTSFIFPDSYAKAETGAASEQFRKVDSYKKASISENTKIIVYYFHGNMRCRSCKTIEKYTKEAVETKYKDQIKKGLVEIRTVNVEKGNNSHFIKDYQLVSRSVVVSKVKNGEEKEWKRLDKVWSLLNNESKFFEYIQENIESLIKGKA